MLLLPMLAAAAAAAAITRIGWVSRVDDAGGDL